MSTNFFRPDHPEPDGDLVIVEVRAAERPLAAAIADEPLPDWLDLALCIAAPTVVALVVLLLFRLGAVVSAGG